MLFMLMNKVVLGFLACVAAKLAGFKERVLILFFFFVISSHVTFVCRK